MRIQLKNPPESLQRPMEVILADIRWQLAIVYFEKVVISLKSTANHIEHVSRVLRLPYEAGVTAKLKNCYLFAETIEYFGHVIRPGHLERAVHTTSEVAKLEPSRYTE